ncbi:Heme oxygenase [Corynebacterium capitovis DSM 44611]|uniref:biliverdin-producing heme oxygenase n=1 Tax=Corynebacterium capitovis TaxID=131081 RepID=UPI00036C6BEA|nr:biliverdin-producing heme oxygenase [Corynebacterium capitovis]WKD58004.1 Heme oxygenase [Corynebacterium capitovis DSM 44611]
MTTAANPTLPLSAALRDGTREAHESAENSTFMSDLIGGKLSPQDVVNLTAQYWFIYTALEDAVVRASGDAAVAAIADRRLERTGALARDLEAMVGRDWFDEIEATPATETYVDTLNALDPQDTPTVIAHHYVRYLGDIAGGQVVARCLSSEYGFESACLNFYDFSAIGKIPPFRARYREALDSVDLTQQQREDVIAAARQAFSLNQNVFASLESRGVIVAG